MSYAYLLAIGVLSAIFWEPGAWIGGRIGVVARHAIGWLTALLGAGIAILLLSFVEAPDHSLRDFRGPEAALALLRALLIGTIVAATRSILEYLWPDRRQGKALPLDVRDRDMEV
jgi:hypothetical protein